MTPRPLGVNTWVWTSPLTDENLPGLARRIADLGFDAIELPLENVGDLDHERPVLLPCRNRRRRSLRMLGDVRERLARDEVRVGLDLGGEALGGGLDRDRYR